jgi:drug/metabolite transporter (DMT)-like permease
MFISSILLFAYNGATGTSVSLTAIPAISWWSIAYLFWFCTYFYCLYLCTAKSSAEISSVYAYINPYYCGLLGAAIFGETLNAAIAIGGGVTLFGLYLVIRCEDALRIKSISYFQLMY